MEMVSYISVILPLKLEWEPCYGVPSAIHEANGGLHAGDRVRVIFAGKEYIGAVSAVDLEPQTELSRIKPIISVEKALGHISQEEIDLWRTVAGYYLCTTGEVYKAAYPTGKIRLEEARAAAKARAEERASRQAEKAAEAIRRQISTLQARLEKKTVMLDKARKESTRATYADEIRIIREAISIKESELASSRGIAAGTYNVEGPSKGGSHTEGQIAGSAGEQSQVQACGICIGQTEQFRPAPPSRNPGNLTELSPAQEKAYIQIREAFAQKKPVLLKGLTGSGKTEIYIRLAMDAMSKGKNVLYLVPEIAISRQLEDRLSAHFGERLLTFHSGESIFGRRDTAEAIRSSKTTGNTYIVLGTRSAIFLPHHGLGLIIIDEEHDSSYKQDSPAPRYNGRDTAIMLAQIHSRHGSVCDTILGSATPSLEEIFNCSTGRHMLVSLDERYHGAADSRIEIIDTKAERRKRGMAGSFSRKLIGYINETLSSGGQAIILRSRRAWAPALQCDNCGDIPKCPHCNVSLSFHSPYAAAQTEAGISGAQKTADAPGTGTGPAASMRQGYMACHYCGYRAAYTGICGKCSGTLRSLGAGTQKIEEEAAALFPGARIDRLDSDTMQDSKRAVKTIRDFSNGDIDILIGTQMVTKGFDFSNLRLVAVIAADSLLGMQDFRADEKALQTLEQFRGRCGRRGERGLFVIQTSQPDHPVYRRLAEGETAEFSMGLLQERKDFSFPPFTRIIEITVKASDEAKARQTAQSLAVQLRTGLETDRHDGPAFTGTGISPVTGPYAPIVSRIADRYIMKIRVSLKKDRRLQAGKEIIQKAVKSAEKTAGGHCLITIDVDPA